MRSTSVLAPWGIILATVMLAACTTDEPEASFGMSFHHMFDGGIQFKENGKPIKCEANMKWGCCKMGFVAFCKGGYVYIGGCSSKPKCGWNASLNHYACGTSGAQDPSGKHLQDCDKLEDDGGGPAPPDSYIQVCGKLPPQGCCDGFMLARCDSGQSVHEDCSQKSLQCGWNGTKKRYECGSSSKADPSGKYPISCKGYMPDGGMSGKDGAPPPVGDGFSDGTGPGPQKCGKLPAQGCCGGDMLDYCQNGYKQTLDCKSNAKCGWNAAKSKYTCGTSGTQDPGGKYPISCKSYMEPPKNDGGGLTYPDGTIFNEGGPSQGCDKLPAQGCCGGNTLDYCQNNNKMNKDCKSSPKCGWNSAQKKYTCGTGGTADPSGKFPMSCKSYLPDGGSGPGDGMGPPPTEGGPGPSDGGGPSKTCGKLPSQGCCQGHMLDYCQNGNKTSMSCQSKPKCGWSSAQKKYTCGTGGTADPSGKFPMSCKSYLDPIDVGLNKDGPKIPDMPKPPQDGPKLDKPKPPQDGPKLDKPKPPQDGPKLDKPKPPQDGPKLDKPKPPQDGPKAEGVTTTEGGAKKPGTEGGPCYGNGTCNTGLRCLSSWCVKVPETEAGPKSDAGDSKDEVDIGCDCAVTSPSPPVWTLLLLALVMLDLRRRRRR